MKLRPFELALVTIFLVLAILAVVLLMLYEPSESPDNPSSIGEVVVWGTLPADALDEFLRTAAEGLPLFRQVEYRYIPVADFDNTFIRALADDSQPDLILIPHEALVTHRDRLIPPSTEQMSLRTFRDTYLDGTEIFILENQVQAVPVGVDPLVLFWNRSLLGSANLLTAPATWEEFSLTTVPRLTRREFDRTITQSAVAFGEARNVTHFYPVLSLLALQQGSLFVTEGPRGYNILLDSTAEGGGRPFSQALEFFMRFSDPTTPEYSWNRALGVDRQEFLRERLALYFGLSSEVRELTERNPNLNFDVAEVPQGANAGVRRTFGRFYGLALVRGGANPAGAARLQALMSDPATGYAASLAVAGGLVPVDRQSVALGTEDPYSAPAYRSAVVARGWLAPGMVETDAVFTAIIEASVTDRTDIASAADNGLLRLQREY
jgi:ABC-type glycerol-3-phosphate transport system substrate-binding protein